MFKWNEKGVGLYKSNYSNTAFLYVNYVRTVTVNIYNYKNLHFLHYKVDVGVYFCPKLWNNKML